MMITKEQKDILFSEHQAETYLSMKCLIVSHLKERDATLYGDILEGIREEFGQEALASYLNFDSLVDKEF